MALYCAISNEVPEQPVVSPSSGAVFEKRVIEKYIIENGVDPINGKELRVEDLIEIKTPPIVKPKPPSATSIPATLKSMQDEWDALMLHAFTQRQQLQTARQELSHALYQHDAACRVIARLTKEVTAAREALATLKPQAGIVAPQPTHQAEAGAAGGGGVAPVGMSSEVVSRLQERATALTQERKRRGRTVPEGLLAPDQIRAFLTLASHPGLHSASVPGILALDINPSDHSKLLTGGNDRNATVFNKDTEQVVAILKGHTKKVTRVIYHPDEDTVITASPDHTIRVWNVPTSQTTVILRSHDGPVTGLSLHPTGDYVLSTSTDQHWAFSDIRTGTLLTKVSDFSGVSLTTAQFHPDGLIFGTGTENSQVKIWDLKEQSNVANFPGHVGPVTSISFSENGYYLATAAEDACVKLWDLRKLKNFKTIQLEEGYAIKELCFDQSGTYLAIAGTDVRVYLCRQWQELKVFNDHTASATGVRFDDQEQRRQGTELKNNTQDQQKHDIWDMSNIRQDDQEQSSIFDQNHEQHKFSGQESGYQNTQQSNSQQNNANFYNFHKESSFHETHHESNQWHMYTASNSRDQTMNTNINTHTIDTNSPTAPLASIWDKLGNLEPTLLTNKLNKSEEHNFSQTQNNQGYSMQTDSHPKVNETVQGILDHTQEKEKEMSVEKSNITRNGHESSHDVGRGDISSEDLIDSKPDKHPFDTSVSMETTQNKNIKEVEIPPQTDLSVLGSVVQKSHDQVNSNDKTAGQSNINVFNENKHLTEQSRDLKEQRTIDNSGQVRVHTNEFRNNENKVITEPQNNGQNKLEQKPVQHIGQEENLEQQNLEDFSRHQNVEQQSSQDFFQQHNLDQQNLQDFGQQHNFENFDQHENMEQQNLQDFGQHVNMEQQNLEDFGQQQNMDQQNLQDFGQHENMDQQNLQDFSQQQNMEQESLQEFGHQADMQQQNIHDLEHKENLDQQNVHDFGQHADSQKQRLHNIWQQADLQKESETHDLEQKENLDQQNVQDFGQQVDSQQQSLYNIWQQADLQQQSVHVIENKENLDQQNIQDFGQQVDSQQHNSHNIWQQADLQQQSVHDLEQKENKDQQNIQDFSQQVDSQQQSLHNIWQQADLQQQSVHDLVDKENLDQQNIQEFGQQTDSHQQGLHNIWQQTDLQQQNVHDFGQQENLDVEPINNNGRSNNYNEKKEHDITLPTHKQPPTYPSPPKELEEVVEVKKHNYDLHSISSSTTVAAPVEPTTEKPGFWKSIGNKFTNAKNKIASWF